MTKNNTASLDVSQVTGLDESLALTESSSPSTKVERQVLARMLKSFGDPAVRVRLWDGYDIAPTSKPAVVTVNITTRSSLKKLFTQQGLGFGDEYAAGRIIVDGDLLEFVMAMNQSRMDIEEKGGFAGAMIKIAKRRPRGNTMQDSKANIHHHYDLGNAFYRLWLDEKMQYTCAYFPDQTISLEQAQTAKLDHVCRKLQLKPGDRVTEAGCGWGGLARHMAKHYGVKVRAYNISHEQVAFAREQAEREGLSNSVEYVLDDYRNLDGKFDAFVSIGMLEHVGTKNYRELGGVINRCLTDSGRAVIHTIGRNKPRLMNAWIERRIFPGAYPPTLREMMDIVEPYNFSILDVENMRLHYAKTLEHWLDRFNAEETVVTEMFDDAFVRAWRLYLTGSIAAFLTSSLQLFQMVFARGRDNTVPWSREHIYSSN